MSIGTLIDRSNIVIFIKDKCLIFNNPHDKQIIGFDNKDSTNGIYKMGDNTFYVNIVVHNEEVRLWHERYVYLNYQGLQHFYLKNRVSYLSKIYPIKDIFHDYLVGC